MATGPGTEESMRKGFTLIELIITVAVILILVIGISIAAICVFAKKTNILEENTVAYEQCLQDCYPQVGKLGLHGDCQCDSTMTQPESNAPTED